MLYRVIILIWPFTVSSCVYTNEFWNMEKAATRTRVWIVLFIIDIIRCRFGQRYGMIQTCKYIADMVVNVTYITHLKYVHTRRRTRYWRVSYSAPCHSVRESWWRHRMETFSALLVLCAGNSLVTDEFQSQRPVMWSFGDFFDLRLNKGLSSQSWSWRFETPLRSLWCHGYVLTVQ